MSSFSSHFKPAESSGLHAPDLPVQESLDFKGPASICQLDVITPGMRRHFHDQLLKTQTLERGFEAGGRPHFNTDFRLERAESFVRLIHSGQMLTRLRELGMPVLQELRAGGLAMKEHGVAPFERSDPRQFGLLIGVPLRNGNRAVINPAVAQLVALEDSVLFDVQKRLSWTWPHEPLQLNPPSQKSLASATTLAEFAELKGHGVTLEYYEQVVRDAVGALRHAPAGSNVLSGEGLNPRVLHSLSDSAGAAHESPAALFHGAYRLALALASLSPKNFEVIATGAAPELTVTPPVHLIYDVHGIKAWARNQFVYGWIRGKEVEGTAQGHSQDVRTAGSKHEAYREAIRQREIPQNDQPWVDMVALGQLQIFQHFGSRGIARIERVGTQMMEQGFQVIEAGSWDPALGIPLLAESGRALLSQPERDQLPRLLHESWLALNDTFTSAPLAKVQRPRDHPHLKPWAQKAAENNIAADQIRAHFLSYALAVFAEHRPDLYGALLQTTA